MTTLSTQAFPENIRTTHFMNSRWFRFYVAVLLVGFPALLYLGAGFLQAYFLMPALPNLNSNEYVMKRLHLRDWAPLDNISLHVADVVVVSEDDGFFQNRGIDWESIKRALREDWEAGRLKRGGSTLTQQVVKNVFLTRQKTLTRKIAEMVLASQVPRYVPKKRVLEVYLNCAQWGDQLYGISAAARFYFKKTPSQLNVKEGAFLAMMLPNPIRYGKSFEKGELTPYAQKEIQALLDRMREEDLLTDDECASLKALPLAFEKKAVESNMEPAAETSPPGFTFGNQIADHIVDLFEHGGT
jgi:monofunctional biosynthetic peptidoglycan transglycosylase